MSAPERPAREPMSQRQIDELLGGTGAAPALTVAPYDFLRPPRISKERRLTLEAIFSRAGSALQATLSSRLRTPMDVACSVEQATFSEFVLAVPNPCAAFVFDLGGGAAGQGAVELSLDLAFLVVDRVFGGPGEALALERPLTMLERTVVQGFVEKLLAAVREVWQEHLDMAPALVGFESTPDMLRIANREDNVLVTRFEVRSGDFASHVTLCLPFLALEGFLGEKLARGAAVASPVPAGQRALIEAGLRAAHVELAARFPPLRLAARDVAELQPGQIIATTQPIDAPIELHINGQCRFLGALGQYRRTLGLRITQAVGTRAGPGRASRGRIQ